MNTFRENDGEFNVEFDALDDSNGVCEGSTGAGNEWVDNDFLTCAGFLDPPCPQ